MMGLFDLTNTRKTALCLIAAVLCLMLGLAACTPSKAPNNSKQAEYTDDSLIAYHDTLGLDWSGVQEVSATTCTSSSSCHGGSWDSVVESTDELFEGIGQIPNANPHYAHGTNGFECSDCHSLSGTSVLECNECHNFEAPEGWNNPDPRTTLYGPSSETAPYTGDGVVDALAEDHK